MPTKTERPTEIVVGPLRYAILYDLRNDDNLGFTNHQLSEIVIRPGLSASLEKETLVHEMLHCLWYISGMGEIKKKEEETFVAVQSPWLLMFLSDPRNEGFLKYISQ